MSDAVWTAVDAYASACLHVSGDALDAALAAQRTAGLPEINVSPNQGKFLMLLARSIGARRILEVGTLAAYSTIWLARAAGPEGRVVTLELDPAHAEVARASLAHAGFAATTEVLVGAALETLPQLAAEEAPFDFFFLDADKVNYPNYLPWLLRLARPGAVIVADNVVRGGAVIDATSANANVVGVRRFLELVGREPRLEATVIQTVGNKGYDGFAMAIVT